MENLKLTTLISKEEIKKRVGEIGAELTKKFSNEPVVAICILKGSFVFFSDLIREIESDIRCEFMGLSSYHDAMTSSGDVKITSDINTSVDGKNVLVIEDIIDTGLTMNYLQQNLKQRKAKSVTTITLLHKPSAQKVDCQIDYVGFEIPNDFVVGYGLDYQNEFRNLPYIAQVQNMN